MGAALHGLLQVWDELVSGLEQIQTSPEGLDVVFASSPNQNTVLEGSWRRPFAVLSFLPQCPLAQKAAAGLGWALHWYLGSLGLSHPPGHTPSSGCRGCLHPLVLCFPLKQAASIHLHKSINQSPEQGTRLLPATTKSPLCAAALPPALPGLAHLRTGEHSTGTARPGDSPQPPRAAEEEQLLRWDGGGEFPRQPSPAQPSENPVTREERCQHKVGCQGWGQLQSPGRVGQHQAMPHMNCPGARQTGGNFRRSCSPSPP